MGRGQAENHENVVFPNAMIAGDCVITDLLSRLDILKNGKAKIMVVDTFHLFPETMEFLSTIEKHYGFKAEVFQAEGCKDKAEYDKKFGADLWQVDIEQYDKVIPAPSPSPCLNKRIFLSARRAPALRLQ